MNPQQIPGHVPQSYLQPQNSSKFTKGESPSYATTPGRQGCSQTPPRVGRSVAAVVPMNAKPHPMDLPPDLGPDGYNQGQMMPPGHPQSMQNFQRGPIGPPQLNPQNVPPPPYAPPPSGPAMMGGGRGPMQQQQPFNPLPNQMPQEVMIQQQQQQQQQQHHQQQRFPSPQQQQQQLHQTLPGGPRFQQNFQMDSMPPQMLPDPSHNDGMEFRVNPNTGMMSPGLAPSYDGFGGKSAVGVPRMGVRLPADINVGVQPQFMQSQSQGIPTNSTAADHPANSMGSRYNLGGSEAPSSAQSTMCAPSTGPGNSRVSAPTQSQPPRSTNPPSKPTTCGLRDNLPSMSMPAGPPSFPLPVPDTLCAACRRGILVGQEKALENSTAAAAAAGVDFAKMSNRQHHQEQQQQLPIQCDAGCREWFHLACSGLTSEAFFLLKGEPLAEWLCNNCVALAYPNIPYIRLH
uniref:PHD-type domain-containing protein n=1 Tax=Schistocephalus solidus TaxID=70667 RepID=A0A0X3NHR8_SCHSO